MTVDRPRALFHSDSASIRRVVVCGAVDDGKSTLIGRLLAETGSVPADEVLGLGPDTNSVDFSRLTDGLESEQEQGITIDVAYRYLRLENGIRILLADSPGHEQYTRNMAVASSLADVAILVVDATRGIRRQTLRHAEVCRLMGVHHLVVAINKLDAVKNPGDTYREIRTELDRELNKVPTTVVAVSGLRGDNVTLDSTVWTPNLSQTLVSALTGAIHSVESVEADPGGLRLPIQLVLRKSDTRRYAGRIARGRVAQGDIVSIWPSNARVRVARVFIGDHEVDGIASAGQSVALEFEQETDIGRGDMAVDGGAEAESIKLPVSRAHVTDLVWLDEAPFDAKASYTLRVGPTSTPTRIDQIRYIYDLDSREEVAGTTLRANDIARVEITCDRPLLLDPYRESRHTGGFILCDRLTGKTVAAGMSVHPLQRESEVTRHSFSVTRSERERMNGVRAGVMWLTGLPGSGKSSIADEAERQLFARGIRSVVLDGDTIRQTLSEDLGFSPDDRKENVRRVARTAQLMMDAGLVVIVSLVSPFRADREAARELFAHSDFIEVWVDTPLEVCQERDPKGLYARASADSSVPMTGVGQAYEIPDHPDIQLDGTEPIVANAEKLTDWVLSRRPPRSDSIRGGESD